MSASRKKGSKEATNHGRVTEAISIEWVSMGGDRCHVFLTEEQAQSAIVSLQKALEVWKAMRKEEGP